MNGQTVYLKCLRSAKVSKEDVFLGDVCSLRCADLSVTKKCRAIKVHQFQKNSPKRHVVSVLRLVELMEDICPGITVEVIGETDVLIEYIKENRSAGIVTIGKIAVVCLVSFFGTAFTIMAYHNDIGINAIFSEMYRILLDEKPSGLNALEISYSLGVAIGMLVFFNHSAGKTITEDPTPIQVAMRNYEKDVDNALAETAERTGDEEDNKA